MNILRLKSDRGFTLIELLVVIAIIGILAAIAIPQFAAYRRRGYEADAQSAVRNLATAEEGYFASKSLYISGPGNSLAAFGFNQSATINITAESFASGGSTYFRITGNSTKCLAGGTYTFNSQLGETKLAASCT